MFLRVHTVRTKANCYSATHGMRALVPVRRGAPESPSIEPKDLPRAEVLIIIDPGTVPVILKMPPLRRGRCAIGVEKASTFAAAEPYAGADNPIRALRPKACGKGLAVCCSAAISRLPRHRSARRSPTSWIRMSPATQRLPPRSTGNRRWRCFPDLRAKTSS